MTGIPRLALLTRESSNDAYDGIHWIHETDTRAPLPASWQLVTDQTRAVVRSRTQLHEVTEKLQLPTAQFDAALVATTDSTNAYIPSRLADTSYYLSAKPGSTTKHQIDRLTIYTGSCLFGRQALQITLADGAPLADWIHPSEVSSTIAEITVNEKLSLYELDTADRLIPLTAQVAAANVGTRDVEIVNVHPRAHYYCGLIDLLAQGLLTVEQFDRWCDTVDRRFRMLTVYWTHRIERELAQHVSVPVKVLFTSGLEPIAGLLRAAGRRVPPMTQLLDRLAQHDPMWTIVARDGGPRSYAELANVAYAVSMLGDGDRRFTDPFHLTVSVDDVMERKILRRASQLAKAWSPTGDKQFAGLYSRGHIILGEPKPWHGVYYASIAPELVDSAGIRYRQTELRSSLVNRLAPARARVTPGLEVGASTPALVNA